jgi:hypothetical protein
MATEEEVRAAFIQQGSWCKLAGSPFTGLVCDLAGQNLTHDTYTGAHILSWRGNPAAKQDNVPLRFAGALHALARQGHKLKALYPPYPAPRPDDLWQAIEQALIHEDAHFQSYLAVAPQTNEVMRSAVLMLGFLTIASQSTLPMHLYEIGASAGLNLHPEKYAYQWGDAHWGNPASPVYFKPEWTGIAPVSTSAPVRILSRQGVDINPINIADPAARNRLQSYVWPDQPERMERLDAALKLVLSTPVALARADAADWLEQTLQPLSGEHSVRVVFHSICWQYLPQTTKMRLTAHLEKLGARATQENPLAWLRLEEPDSNTIEPNLRLQIWPDGSDRLLAHAHPHGRIIHWLGAA